MKIKVEPLLPTGNYLNVRIGIEKDFPDNASEMESVFEVWDNIIAMHMKRYPHLYKDGQPLYEGYKGEEQTPEVQLPKEPVIKLSKEEKQKKCITDTTQIEGADGLKSFALLVKNNPHLQETYNGHLKKLQDGLQ